MVNGQSGFTNDESHVHAGQGIKHGVMLLFALGVRMQNMA
jgi:hypothetical protein